jgi:hypothetical protein
MIEHETRWKDFGPGIEQERRAGGVDVHESTVNGESTEWGREANRERFPRIDADAKAATSMLLDQ